MLEYRPKLLTYQMRRKDVSRHNLRLMIMPLASTHRTLSMSVTWSCSRIPSSRKFSGFLLLKCARRTQRAWLNPSTSSIDRWPPYWCRTWLCRSLSLWRTS